MSDPSNAKGYCLFKLIVPSGEFANIFSPFFCIVIYIKIQFIFYIICQIFYWIFAIYLIKKRIIQKLHRFIINLTTNYNQFSQISCLNYNFKYFSFSYYDQNQEVSHYRFLNYQLIENYVVIDVIDVLFSLNTTIYQIQFFVNLYLQLRYK